MATTQAKANPKKKSSGFQGVRDAIWIIVACFILAVCFFKFVLGNPDNFVGGDPANAVKDGSLLGTVYKGGIVVPVIITLLFTVIALSIERFFALRTAFGKSSLGKFVISVKQAITAGDMAKAQQICDKQQGCVANVVGASIAAYKEMENTPNLKRAAKVAKIQQAHEEATQLEMPTLQMNMPILATIVTLGTLTALFGTVVGMIMAFDKIEQVGDISPTVVAGGMKVALITTVGGLIVALILQIFYNYLLSKLESLLNQMEDASISLIDLVIKYNLKFKK